MKKIMLIGVVFILLSCFVYAETLDYSTNPNDYYLYNDMEDGDHTTVQKGTYQSVSGTPFETEGWLGIAENANFDDWSFRYNYGETVDGIGNWSYYFDMDTVRMNITSASPTAYFGAFYTNAKSCLCYYTASVTRFDCYNGGSYDPTMSIADGIGHNLTVKMVHDQTNSECVLYSYYRDNMTLLNYGVKNYIHTSTNTFVQYYSRNDGRTVFIDNVMVIKGNDRPSSHTTAGALFSTPVSEETSQTLTLNINTYINGTNISANLIYNNTVYNATKTSYGNWTNFTATITTPTILEGQKDIQLYFNYSFASTGFSYNTSNGSMTVLGKLLDSCGGVTNATFINVTFLDEFTDVELVSDIEANFKIWITSPDIHKNFTFKNLSQKSFKYCLFPPWQNYTTDAYFNFNSNGYPYNNYYLVNQSINNNTLYQNLYLLDENNATQVRLYVTDSLDNVLEDYYVYLLRKDFTTGTYKTVSGKKTDNDGLVYFNVVLNNVFYKWLFLDSGGKVIHLTDDNTIKLTTLYYKLNLDTDYLQKWANIDGISSSLTIDNATGLVTFTYTDSSALDAQYCLKVSQFQDIATTEIYSSCQTAKSGAITYTLPDLNTGSYVAKGVLITSGSLDYSSTLLTKSIKYGNNYRIFGKLGLITAILWVMALIAVGGVLAGLSGSVVGSLIGLLSAVLLQFIAIQYSILISLIILAGVVIWKVKS